MIYLGINLRKYVQHLYEDFKTAKLWWKISKDWMNVKILHVHVQGDSVLSDVGSSHLGL